ncbi:MAG: DJ-1/PfpI family protein [Treponema sp.]|nr:DJ-1/PfpI family protein [Treponema sp.]
MKKAIVFLADGFEEIEAFTPIDYLRRAGIEVITAGLSKNEIIGAHNIRVLSDVILSENLMLEKFDALILPGGMNGSVNLAASSTVEHFLKDGLARNAILAAICAAPIVVFAKAGLLKNRHYTCYPSMETENEILKFVGKNYKSLMEGSVHSNERVVVDANMITARGPGVAEEFSLALVENLAGSDAKESLKNAIVAR